MHVADDVVLDQFAVDGAEGDPPDRIPVRVADDHRRAARPCDRLVAREFGAQRLDERVAVGGLIRPVEVDVDYQPATGWSILRDRGDIVESRTESVEFGHRRDQMQPVALEVEVTGYETAVDVLENADVFERVNLVVATRDDLEQRAAIAVAEADLSTQQVQERFGSGDEIGDSLVEICSVRLLFEVGEVAAYSVVDVFANLADARLVEEPEAKVAGDVADDGVADLRRDDESIENLVELLRRATGSLVADEPAFEKCCNDRDLGFHALQSQEESVHRFLDGLAIFQIGDVVVAKCPFESRAERRRQTFALGVE